MQITTMPAPTVLKSKWNTFITKLSPSHEHATHPRRRRSSAEDHTTNIKQQKRRKHSDAVSVGTYESNVSMADKFRQVIPFFRRSSSNMSSEESLQSAPIVNTTPCSVTRDYYKQSEKLQSLYTLAVDEVIYFLFCIYFVYAYSYPFFFFNRSTMLKIHKDHHTTQEILLLHVKHLMTVQMLSCNFLHR